MSRIAASREIFGFLNLSLSLLLVPHLGVDSVWAEDVTFIHSKTFEGVTVEPQSWDRSALEAETVRALQCDDASLDEGQRLNVLKALFVRLADRDWKPGVKLSECRVCEALSFNDHHQLEESSWSKDAHSLREAMPYVWVSVDAVNMSAQGIFGSSGKVALSTDLMDDIYYDTASFQVLDSDMTLRTRKRWDSFRSKDKPVLRRVLIGTKKENAVDPVTGEKAPAKADVRLDRPEDAIVAALPASVRSGFWNKSGEISPIFPVKLLYEELATRGVLGDEAPYQNVLRLEPKVFLRSLRNRFHYEDVSAETTSSLVRMAMRHAQALVEQSDSKKVSKVAKKILDQGEWIEFFLFRTERSQSSVIPAPQVGIVIPQTDQEIETLKLRTEALSEVFHELGNEVRDHLDELSGTENGDGEERADQMRAFVRETLSTGVLPRTHERAEAIVRGVRNSDSKAQGRFLKAFNDYGLKQSLMGEELFEAFVPLTAQELKSLQDALVRERLKTWSRQCEAAGTALLRSWFLMTEAALLPTVRQARSQLQDFLIDTFDVVGMFSAQPLKTSGPLGAKTMSVDDLTNQTGISDENSGQFLGASVSNEIQVEIPDDLVSVGFFEAAAKDLAALKTAGRDTARAKWILSEYKRTFALLLDMKRSELLDRVAAPQYSDLCSKWKMDPATEAKGVQALTLLRHTGGGAK